MRTHRSNRFIPRLEVLENRCCLSCDIDVVGTTMLITGDDGVNDVSIEHDGAGTVVAQCTGTPDGDAVVSSGIKRVIVDLKDGDDNLTLRLLNPLNVELLVELEMGSGDDQGTLYGLVGGFAAISNKLKLKADLGSGNDLLNAAVDLADNAEVKMEVHGGSGNDQIGLQSRTIGKQAKVDMMLDGADGEDHFGLNVASLGEQAQLKMDAIVGTGDDRAEIHVQTLAKGAMHKVTFDGGDGNDSVLATIRDLDENALAQWDLNGGIGNDNFRVRGVGHLAQNAKLKISLEGDEGRDQLLAVFGYVLEGELQLRVAGGDGDDSAVVRVNAFGEGKLHAMVDGQDGNDGLNLDIHDVGSRLRIVKAVLDGGDGFDSCTSTSNVEEKNCEA